MQDQYLKLPRLNPDALSRCERLLRDWESMAGTDNSVDGCAEELRAALYQTGAAPTLAQQPAAAQQGQAVTDIDLLPLPEDYADEGLWGKRYGPYNLEQMEDYARANVARAVEPLQAEIEALRTEAEQHLRQAMSNGAKARAAQAQVDNLRTEVEALRADVERSERYAEQSERERLWAEERAERLAEALRELEGREQRDEALLRQALEALEYYRSGEDYQPTPASEVITAIKERLK